MSEDGCKQNGLRMEGEYTLWALGYPIGTSGARILTTLLYAMRRYDKKRGLATLCIGGGEASAVIVER